MTMRHYLITILLPLVMFSYKSSAQCTTESEPGCPTSGYSTLGNNANINSGQTWRYNGSSNTYSGVNFSGGTLYVCTGSVTLSSFNFNGGTIYIKDGATLTLSQDMYLNGSCGIYNYGTLTTSGSITLQNSNNMLMNASSSATFNLQGSSKKLSINGSSCDFVNYGTANIKDIQTSASNDAGAVCLAPNSTLNVTDFSSNKTNVFNAPSGDGCMRYTGTATLNSALTGTANVKICKASGASVTGSGGWGSADVTSSCSDCAGVLPVDLLYFKYRSENNNIKLMWATASEENNDYFELFRSQNGKDWKSISTITGAGNSFQITDYEYTDMNLPTGKEFYYKLTQTDFNGAQKEFTPIVVLLSAKSNPNIYPNPSNSTIYVREGVKIGSHIRIMDISGRKVLEMNIEDQNGIDISDLSEGTYILEITPEGKPSEIHKFSKSK